MKSDFRFVMHPADEALVVEWLLRDLTLQFINGARWPSSAPPTTRSIHEVGWYCIIWSLLDLPRLDADFIPSCNDWYCRSEHATIQFLRSTPIEGDVLLEGRFAVATADGTPAATGVERRYKLLRSLLKKSYQNSVVRWRNPDLPELPAGPGRSANPSKPDASLWVGPNALAWLAVDSRRRIAPFRGCSNEGRCG